MLNSKSPTSHWGCDVGKLTTNNNLEAGVIEEPSVHFIGFDSQVSLVVLIFLN